MSHCRSSVDERIVPLLGRLRPSDPAHKVKKRRLAFALYLATQGEPRTTCGRFLNPRTPKGPKGVDEYLEELDKLYQNIEAWLPESAQTEKTDTVFEFWDGHYSAPALNIRYGDISLRAIPAGISFGVGSLIYFLVPPEHRDSYPPQVHIPKHKHH